MNREIKFKSKVLENISKPDKYYWLEYTLTEAIFKDLAVDLLRSVATCNLITKIDEVEVYEYDCYYDLFTNVAFYFYYDELGILNIKYPFELKLKKQIDVNAKKIRKILDFKFLKFIGNWHDGEEYLLNKIKEKNKWKPA